MSGSDLWPAIGHHTDFPPVPLFRGGTPAERVLAALGHFPDGATLDKVAHRADLGMDEVRAPLQGLLLRGLIRFRDIPGHWQKGEWREGHTLIHLTHRDMTAVGMFEGGCDAPGGSVRAGE